MIQVDSHCLKGMLIQIMTNYGDPHRNHIYLMALTTFPARQSLKIMELFAAANYIYVQNEHSQKKDGTFQHPNVFRSKTLRKHAPSIKLLGW